MAILSYRYSEFSKTYNVNIVTLSESTLIDLIPTMIPGDLKKNLVKDKQ